MFADLNSYTLLKPLAWLTDALFPRTCLGCGSLGSYLCASCSGSLTFPRELGCPTCGEKNALGEFCERCLSDGALRGVWVTQNYGNPLVKNLIQAFKYDYLTELAAPLGGLLSATLETYHLPPAWHEVPREHWHLTPIPLSSKRLRERGFNQAALLSERVSAASGLAQADVLQRLHSTKPQSKLTPEERAQNVLGAFRLRNNDNLRGNAYILVDDVYTSGSTLSECARLLTAHGAREVWGLVVAKG